MKNPEDVKVEFVIEWVKKAESDYRAAAHLVRSGKEFADSVSLALGFAEIVREKIRSRLPVSVL